MRKLMSLAALFIAGSAMAATEDYYVAIKDPVVQNTKTGGTARIAIMVGNNGTYGDEHYGVYAAAAKNGVTIPLNQCAFPPLGYLNGGEVKQILEIDFEWSNFDKMGNPKRNLLETANYRIEAHVHADSGQFLHDANYSNNDVARTFKLRPDSAVSCKKTMSN